VLKCLNINIGNCQNAELIFKFNAFKIKISGLFEIYSMLNSMHPKILLTLLCILSGTFSLTAQQNKCGSYLNRSANWQKKQGALNHSQEVEKSLQLYLASNAHSLHKKNNVITIPVVVHVIWNNATQNISDAQILSQLAVLNKDFRKRNTDTLNPNHPFASKAADVGFEFCLAQRDPSGNATNGITRTQTAMPSWIEKDWDKIKFTNAGGKSNWDPYKYLNIWVVSLADETLGFATFPDELAADPQLDGIVIRHEAFGTIGTAGSGDYSQNAKGRTATHEIGHWLNLNHIWGDDFCGNDFVSDTEPAEDANYDCPSFPYNANNACGAGSNGEMYMNFLDYTDDNCMSIFTSGQANRMRASLNSLRAQLLNSTACNPVNGLNQELIDQVIAIYPNPAHDFVTLKMPSTKHKNAQIMVVDILGRTVIEMSTSSEQELTINVAQLKAGTYFVSYRSEEFQFTKKLIIQ
jgi:hypothetical protein